MLLSALVLGHGDGMSGLELPPLHPILVNFTAALVPVSFLSDLLGRWLRRDTLRATGWWTLLYAAAITPLTAAAGWYWARDMEGMDPTLMNAHRWVGIALAVLLPAVVFWRHRFHRRQLFPSWPYLGVTGLLVATLVVQGHMGGLMSFGGGGSDDDHHEAQPAVTPDGVPPLAGSHGDAGREKTGHPAGGHEHAGDGGGAASGDGGDTSPSTARPAGTPDWQDSIPIEE